MLVTGRSRASRTQIVLPPESFLGLLNAVSYCITLYEITGLLFPRCTVPRCDVAPRYSTPRCAAMTCSFRSGRVLVCDWRAAEWKEVMDDGRQAGRSGAGSGAGLHSDFSGWR